MQPICIYHKKDLDGKCSAAIVQHSLYESVELYGMDYGDPIPWEKLENRKVIMVDFSFQPFSDMIKLKTCASSLVWIDHHKSAIEDAATHNFESSGFRDIDYAACELTWAYFRGMPVGSLTKECLDSMPQGVRLLGRYDIWKHEEDANTLFFQLGMKCYDTRPTSNVWISVLRGGVAFIDEVVDKGKLIADYVKRQNAGIARTFCFEMEWEGVRIIAANVPGNSQIFDGVFDPEKHDMMCLFTLTPKLHWTVSFYSTKSDVDCSALAKKCGGGGHKKAAGFSCATLPFSSLIMQRVSCFVA
jgi:oligoribonuclease NrnB/cAMP/cGMP phosphodiesterase (DHH superfamily)